MTKELVMALLIGAVVVFSMLTAYQRGMRAGREDVQRPVARSLADRLYPKGATIDVRDFGWIEGMDNAGALQAAQDWAQQVGGTVFIPGPKK